MNSAGRSNISSIFQHGLQDGYLSLNAHVKGGLFPLSRRGVACVKITITKGKADRDVTISAEDFWY